MISKSRPTRGRIGTPYYIETIYQVKKSCRNCIYYEKEDQSCSKKPIVLSEIGFNHYKNCKYFEEAKGKNNANVNQDKKIEKNVSNDKFYNNKVSYKNENAIILKEASNDQCGLCNKLDKSSKVYYIDNNKGEDKDSVLNMVNLCNNCERKVSKNRSYYSDILKEKAEEIMNSIILNI